MLHLDLKVGEKVDIDNGRVVVRLDSKSGQVARLSFEAAPNIRIRRLETEAPSAVRRLAPIE